MLRYLYAVVLVLAVTAAHAQNPKEVERLCRHMTGMPEIVEIFMTCEPEWRNEGGRKRYADMPWNEKVVALMMCLKSGKGPKSVTEQQRVAVQFCFGELED